MSDYPRDQQDADRLYAEREEQRRAKTPIPDRERLRDWSDERVVAALLSHLYRVLDAGGISCGRSMQSVLAEPALRLMDKHRPHGDINDWPSQDATIREAHERTIVHGERQRLALLAAEDGQTPAKTMHQLNAVAILRCEAKRHRQIGDSYADTSPETCASEYVLEAAMAAGADAIKAARQAPDVHEIARLKSEFTLAVDAIIERLFTNGVGEKADRLVLTQDRPFQRDLGGWGRLAVRDQILDMVRSLRAKG